MTMRGTPISAAALDSLSSFVASATVDFCIACKEQRSTCEARAEHEFISARGLIATLNLLPRPDSGVGLVLKERQRTIEIEHCTPAGDDALADGELALLAVCYASPVQLFIHNPEPQHRAQRFIDPWPTGRPPSSDRRVTFGSVQHNRDLSREKRIDLTVKATNLLVFEVDRLIRSRT
jgi:hypothetical protein